MKQEAPTEEGGHQRRCHDPRIGEEVTVSLSAHIILPTCFLNFRAALIATFKYH